MTNFECKLDECLDYIKNDDVHNNNKIIYVSIGSAHHMTYVVGNKKMIEIQYDQQYPMFLRNIKHKYPFFKLYIILIDPMLENPCFTISEKNITSDRLYDEAWLPHTTYTNIYKNSTDDITLFEYRQYVHYVHRTEDNNEWIPEGSILIESLLEKMNNMAIERKWFTILMDYTGRPLDIINQKYSDGLKDDNDHIFYGLPSRVDGGCYIDLSDPETFIITNMDKGYLTAFTPYNYSHSFLNEMYKKLKDNVDQESIILCNQIKKSLKLLIDTFINNVACVYRKIFSSKKNIISHGTPFVFCDREISYINSKYNNVLNIKLINENIDDALKIISDIMDEEFSFLINFFDIDTSVISKKEIMGFYYHEKMNEDCYKGFAGITDLFKFIKL